MRRYKPWHTSRTLWLNALTVATMVFALTELGNVLPPDSGKYVALANAIVNIILRVYFTSQPIAAPAPSRSPSKIDADAEPSLGEIAIRRAREHRESVTPAHRPREEGR